MGRYSSPMTSRCGPRCDSTSVPSCRGSSARAHSRARHRKRRTSSNAITRRRPRTISNLGIVNIIVGFAPLKPAEFVVISIQQMAGQIAKPNEVSFHGTIQRQCARVSIPTRTSSSASSGMAGMSPVSRKVSALKRTTEMVKHREGGDPRAARKSPGAHRVRRHYARARRDA